MWPSGPTRTFLGNASLLLSASFRQTCAVQTISLDEVPLFNTGKNAHSISFVFPKTCVIYLIIHFSLAHKKN